MKKSIPISPGMISAEKKAYLINAIKNGKTVLEEKKIIAGFDGFIDTIARIIKKKQGQKSPSFFTTIKQFGDYVTEKQAASFSLELEQHSIKLGGNMPIMANALGRLGTKVNCIGALGYPQIHPIFQDFPGNCQLYSFANPGTSAAFEFNDGKMMLADMGSLNTCDWDKIKSRIGIEKLVELYKETDLACFLNWSEIDASTNIWKGLLKDVYPVYKPEKKQIIFVDLSDCSKRDSESIMEMLDLLKEFGRYSHVILSLNKNEAGTIFKTLFEKKANQDIAQIGSKLFEKLGLHILLLHSSKETVAISGGNVYSAKTFYTDHPKISTGAGDNFNAGFCTAQLLQLDMEAALLFANAVSGIYIRTGISAQPEDIVDFFETF